MVGAPLYLQDVYAKDAQQCAENMKQEAVQNTAQEQQQQQQQDPQTKSQNNKIYNASYYVLDNGIQVVVIPAARVPAVTHMVWYKTGAADEPRGVSGIAHFMEHLMFKGSPVIGGDDLSAGEFSSIVRRLGGNDNAFTSQDYTAYFQSVPSAHLETVMRMEAGRMRQMNLTTDEVASERAVILEERSQRTDNNPDAQLGEHIKSALYLNHPYGIPVIGWAHEMADLTLEDATTFHKNWYRPNNAILVVSGDADPRAVLEMAKKTYGTLERGEHLYRIRTKMPTIHGDAHVTLAHETVRQPTVYRVLTADSAAQDKTNALALEVLSDIMGGGASSRLYKALVVEQKIATSAGLSYDPYALDGASLWLYASPAQGQNADDVLAALDAQIDILLRDGLKDGERTDSIARLQNAAIYARDSLSGPAMTIGRALASGMSLDDVEYWARDIAGVGDDDILNAAKAVFSADTRRSVTGFLLPETQDDLAQGDSKQESGDGKTTPSKTPDKKDAP